MADLEDRVYVLVTGSRAWRNVAQLRKALDRVAGAVPYGRVVLFHGGCPTGADKLADEWAATYARPTIEVRRFPAEKHGPWPQCGPVRNSAMVKAFTDEVNRARSNYMVFAFRSPGKSSGTDDCAAKCKRAGMVVELVNEEVANG